VGEGTARELAERAGRRQRVVLRVDGPAEAVAAVLAALPGVERVVREAGAFVLEAAGDGDAAQAVGAAMAAHGWTIRELREETPDLEQSFLRLVRAGPEVRA
jgi:histidinol-phosphate/aromatic aminotransferase/cobyric acid decarboxylase-like protein